MDLHSESRDEFDSDWYATFAMPIEEIRLLYDHVCYAIKTWPGSPARPPEEQEFLLDLKIRLSAALMQHSFDMLDLE
jgi:hypothetical protein